MTIECTCTCGKFTADCRDIRDGESLEQFARGPVALAVSTAHRLRSLLCEGHPSITFSLYSPEVKEPGTWRNP